MSGWIKLYRDLQESWIWEEKPFDKRSAWIDLLLMANYEDKKILLGNELIEAKRGSIITSEVKLAERWGWSRHKVRDFLVLLEKDTMIVKNSDTKRTALNIVNYNAWQDCPTAEGQQKDSEGTAKGQQKDTNKNIENEKNIKNDNGIYMSAQQAHKFIPPTIEEVKAYCEERNNNIDPEKWYDFYESKNWMIGKNKMSNWKAAIRTWEKGNKGERKSSNPFLLEDI